MGKQEEDLKKRIEEGFEKYLEYPELNEDGYILFKNDVNFFPSNDPQQILENIFTSMELEQKLLHDSAVRNEIEYDEIEEFISNNYEDENSTEYLVDGAILTCTNSTVERVGIKEGITEYWYNVPEDAMIGGVVIPSMEKPKVLGYLNVTENPKADINGLKYATVCDSKKETNIPCFGNCKRLPDSEIEKEVFRKIHKEELNGLAKRNEGTCKYLMKLESMWENYDIGKNYIRFIDDDKESKEGITMTSWLFCKHGGFIYPITSGQKMIVAGDGETTEFQFTLEQLKACGWSMASEDELTKLNDAMREFGVTSKESAYMMLATMLAESDNCTITLEGQPERKDIVSDTEWEAYKASVIANGKTIGDYSWWERGAGYIQVTGAAEQERFLKDMQNSYSGKNKASYIGNNYPIEASVWYWSSVQKTGAGNLNAYVEMYGASEGTFLVTQYFINGYVDGIDDTLRSIREGGEYTIDLSNNKLLSIGKEFPLPNDWEKRSSKWQKIEEELQNEK